VTGDENLFIATGHGPSGLTLGAVSGAAVADAILGDSPVAPIAPYAIDRFM
jgi:D-amino-acid dehydrogenase